MTAPIRKRHLLSTRIWHWINAATITVLLMSGLAIFNAHPRLYWGSYGANPDPAWFAISEFEGKGLVEFGSLKIATTSTLGVSKGISGQPVARAFPSWATLPSHLSLSEARRWHLSAAWLFGVGTVLFAMWSFANGHVRYDLWPRVSELRLSSISAVLRSHVFVLIDRDAASAPYNVLQKGTYILVSGIVIPTTILSGLTMSPWMNAVAPWMLDLFAGRQSARSVHFICAFILVLFILVHLLMVLKSGPISQVRAMITGGSATQKDKTVE